MSVTSTRTIINRRVMGDMHAAFAAALDMTDAAGDRDGALAPAVELSPFTEYDASGDELVETNRGYDVTVSWSIETKDGDGA